MRKPRIVPREGPEEKIVQALWDYLVARGWTIKRTHGNLFQAGLPDLWIGHPEFGKRWLEVKNPVSYHFTPAQLEFFPIMTRCKDYIWILTAATQAEYDKLFQPYGNWEYYLYLLNRDAHNVK